MFLSIENVSDDLNKWSLKTITSEYIHIDGKTELIYIQDLWMKEFDDFYFNSNSSSIKINHKFKLSAYAQPFIPEAEKAEKLLANNNDSSSLKTLKTKKNRNRKHNNDNNRGPDLVNVNILKNMDLQNYRPRRAGIIVRVEIKSDNDEEKEKEKEKKLNSAAESNIKIKFDVNVDGVIKLDFDFIVTNAVINNEVNANVKKDIYFGLGVDWKSGDLTDFGGFAEYYDNGYGGFDKTALDTALREFEEESLGVFGKPTKQQLNDSTVIYTRQTMILIVTMNTITDMYSVQQKFKQLICDKDYHEMQNLVWLSSDLFYKLLKRDYARKQKPLPLSSLSLLEKEKNGNGNSVKNSKNTNHIIQKSQFFDFFLYSVVRKLLHGAYYRLKFLF
jgi:hypothetical protein